MSENQYRNGNGEIECFHYFEARECNQTFGISDEVNICIHCGYEEEL
jgi:hypothetical protein